jgi:hypothetical protein
MARRPGSPCPTVQHKVGSARSLGYKSTDQVAEALIRSVYSQGGMNPADTGYVEAHGTFDGILRPERAFIDVHRTQERELGSAIHSRCLHYTTYSEKVEPNESHCTLDPSSQILGTWKPPQVSCS